MMLALFLGIGIVTNQTQTLLKFVAFGGLFFCAMLGHRIWLLMLILSAMNIPLIRGFSSLQRGQALFVGFGLLLIMMRRLPALGTETRPVLLVGTPLRASGS
jgi:apolipoprotein N-acyltransferase